MKQNDEGIILNRISYSETSWIVSVFTKENGLRKFIFQGGKKKQVHLNSFFHVEIAYYLRPESELGKLTQLEPLYSFQAINNNPISSIISYFCSDVLLKCLRSEDKDEYLFQFIISFITSIYEEKDLSLKPVHFLVEIAKFMGIQPHKTSENPKYFNLIEGEFSEIKPKGDLYIQDSTFDLIYNLFNDYQPINTTKLERQQALEGMISYFKIHVPNFGELTTLSVIKELLYE